MPYADPALRPQVVSVVVPVYNEIATVDRCLAALTTKQVPGWALEIIIVESNSTDGTRDVVLAYRDRERVKIILQDRPRGKGHAVRAGLAAATGDVIMIQDADLEYDLDDYELLLAPIASGSQAFVLGSRHRPDGFAMRKFTDQPLQALFMNTGHWFFTIGLNLSLGIWLNDPFTMYKVFRRECIAGLEFQSDRFDFDFELLIKLVRRGYRPMEIPIRYASRSFRQGKKISVWRDPPTWIVAMIKYRFCRLPR